MFVTVVASIQYRALADSAQDAFYKLSNTRNQIQAYVFDGLFLNILNIVVVFALLNPPLIFFFSCIVIRASVPKLDLDSTFEQKNDIAKTVESELEKVNQT